MSLLTVRSLGMALGAPLFSELDLSIDKGDRIGLVAANGRGKSTLLRCLAGVAEPTEGRRETARGVRVTPMLQDPDPRLLGLCVRDVLLEAIAPESRDWEAWRVDVALEALAFPQGSADRPLAALSGGWQRMALLARAALTEPDILLMDEPTNHLDLQRIGALERWIAAAPADMAFVVASHDRAFLDAVTTRTLFLRKAESVAFALPYSAARASLDARDAATARRHATDLRAAAQLRRQAAKLHNIGVNSGSDLLTTKTRQLKERAERIETAARPAHREESAGAITLAQRGTAAKVLMTLDDTIVGTPDGRRLFSTGRRWIRPGDRVVLLGRNGSGKSRFLDLVARAVRGDAVPTLTAGPSLVAGIVDQSISHFGPTETLLAAIVGRFPIGEHRARSLLAGAGFPVERLGATVSALSGGQRARLAMLILRLQEPNFYILDEPTNHLDIEGQEALEDELTRGAAAALIVSHDRRFVETVGSRFWCIDRGRLAETDDPGAFLRSMMASRPSRRDAGSRSRAASGRDAPPRCPSRAATGGRSDGSRS